MQQQRSQAVLGEIKKGKFKALKKTETKMRVNCPAGKVVASSSKLMGTSFNSQQVKKDTVVVPKINYFGDARDDTFFEFLNLIMQAKDNGVFDYLKEKPQKITKDKNSSVLCKEILTVMMIVGCGFVLYAYVA